MNKKISLALSLFSFALLQACGGGGGGSSDTTAPPVTDGAGGTDLPTIGSNTGSVSAPFIGGANARFHLTNPNGQTLGVLSTSVQETSGAMTALSTNVLSGSTAVKEISGDAHYAMGRWTAGTVTTSNGASTLTGTDGRSYHYIAFNAASTFPTSSSLTCDAGAFTAPTPSSNSTGASGSAAGSASLSFGPNGAVVSGTMNVAASGSSGAVNFGGTIVTPTGSVISGVFFGSGAGAYTQVGDAGAGAYLVVSSYAATLANGSRYIGVAKFRCA